ncbi:MAG TPA: hypothetical protein PKC55_08525 [Dysgonomonas sp.]|uniref:DUF6705 family protein n=1 Tax=Dysgonomonas sp. TaxID=1891233 RepID=UPI002CF7674D|nr:DUF6705 family protein [Dysgonomonas sp.]HML64856.1 hypothetical protein [Dysgonomonas sp.]
MKKQIIFLITFIISFSSFSQKVSRLSNDFKILEGTWVATSGNKSYEIAFVKGTIYEKDMKITLESIFGSIKYLENNKVIKTTDINDLKSIALAVFSRDDDRKFEISYSEKDNNAVIYGKVYFDISADGKTAHWYMLRKNPILESTKDNFDIPKELVFTKKPVTKSQSNDQVIPHFEFPEK